LLALGAAIETNPWIEKDSLSSWYPLFREWVHDCGATQTFDAGPLQGTSCVKRSCSYATGSGTYVLHPYCETKKELRDAGGNNLKDANNRDVPGASGDSKQLVDEAGNVLPDGSPIDDAYIPPAKFWAWLDQFLADAPLGGFYGSELVWVSNETVRSSTDIAQGITATRMRANYKASDKADEQVASMVTLRESIASVGAGTTFPYMFMYLYYEQYAIITHEALLNLGLALVAVFVICMVILANFGATILVIICVILVDVNILGLMHLWGLTIDSVAIINLVLAIGLSVDYSVHVAHAFLQTPGTKQERVDKALEEMGTAVVHGAFSTFLAVLVLSTSKSYIFRIFFKQFFGICIFGAAHGLVFLPTLLSLVGPAYVETGAVHTAAAPSGKAAAAAEMTSAVAVPAIQTTPPTSSQPDGEPPASNPPSPPTSAVGSARGMSSPRVAPAYTLTDKNRRPAAPHVV